MRPIHVAFAASALDPGFRLEKNRYLPSGVTIGQYSIRAVLMLSPS
jgi:hypothetical protein